MLWNKFGMNKYKDEGNEVSRMIPEIPQPISDDW
jgi:hypothetical protein